MLRDIVGTARRIVCFTCAVRPVAATITTCRGARPATSASARQAMAPLYPTPSFTHGCSADPMAARDDPARRTSRVATASQRRTGAPRSAHGVDGDGVDRAGWYGGNRDFVCNDGCYGVREEPCDTDIGAVRGRHPRLCSWANVAPRSRPRLRQAKRYGRRTLARARSSTPRPCA